MRIAVNALSVRPDSAGARTIAVGLTTALARTTASHRVLILGGEYNRALFQGTGCAFESLSTGSLHPARRIFVEQMQLPNVLKRWEASGLISLDGTLPRRLPCPSVALFQNLIYFELENCARLAGDTMVALAYGRLQTSYFLSSWKYTSANADVAVAVSQAAKDAFVQRFGPGVGSRIHVIPPGVDERFTAGDGPDLASPYVLGVGTLYPHKHFDTLLRLVAHSATPDNVRAVIVGSDWHGHRRHLRAVAQSLGVAHRVDFLGTCSPDELLHLYRGALCLGQFSEVESFGLPVAEAMACGTPAVVARRSAMPEVGGPGALTIADHDLSSAAEWVTRLLGDSVCRQQWREKALEASRRYDWKSIGEQYWTLLETLRPVHRLAWPKLESGGERRESLYRKMPVPLQHAAVSLSGWHNNRIRYGKEFAAELRTLEASDRYSAADIQSLQEERLQRLVKAAYHQVPFYRDRFDAAGLLPDDIRTAEDLEKLPVLDKREVAAAGARMVNQELTPSVRIAGHTSGSTGTSLALVYDRQALAAEFATVWRLRRRFGCDLDHWHATFAGRLVVPQAQSAPPYHRINYGQKQMLFSLYHLSPETVRHYVETLHRRPMVFYSGYPSALDTLLWSAQEAELDLPSPQQALFTSSESLLAWQKQKLESGFGVRVYDRYGCAEFCVSFTVCEEGRYHLDSEFSVVELEPTEETADTITGVLLCTGLTNLAMPFIRYRVGDVVTLAKSPCLCGRHSMSALDIDGRREDFVITGDGVRLGRLDHLFKDLAAISESQIEQTEAGHLKIRIVRGPEYSSKDEQVLLEQCRKRMGDTMELELEYTDAIPRNARGKFRAVINRLPEAQRYV